MFSTPQLEHKWFDDLLGHWDFSHECIMGPGQPPNKASGKLAARSVGGLWIVMEGSGSSPESGNWASIMTLGFDPTKSQYVGTFIGSMMTNLWVYEGSLDASGKVLTLDVEGPAFDGKGTARYQDIIEMISRDHWVLRSQMLGEDNQWHPFMTGHHHRVDLP